MNNSITNLCGNKRDVSISMVRVLAFLSIITCHIMQYYNFELAWWFNVGVQVFLGLSGYLYGKKDVIDDIEFYKKQFIKILVPYYLVIILVIVAQLIFAQSEISIIKTVKALLVYGTIKGGEHLWFIPTILFCYIITPLINRINNKIFDKNNPLIYIAYVIVLISFLIKLFVNYFNPAWIICFYIGNVMGKNEIKGKLNRNIAKNLVFPITVFLISIQITISYILKIKMSGIMNSLFNIMCNYGHTFLGISLIIILLNLFRRNFQVNNIILKPILFLDSISYEGYLVHQFFILGPFSILSIISFPVVSIVLIFIITFVLGLAINLLNKKIKRVILQ